MRDPSSEGLDSLAHAAKYPYNQGGKATFNMGKGNTSMTDLKQFAGTIIQNLEQVIVGKTQSLEMVVIGIQNQPGTTLMVDIGTNAEIVLGTPDGLFSASSPTGPAFEGAQITFGMRAAPGAIERVRITPETLDVRFRVIGEESWSDSWGEQPPQRGGQRG